MSRVWRYCIMGWLVLASAGRTEDALPHWIWDRNTSGDVGLDAGAGGECRLERGFAVERPNQSAKLRLAADFCQATVRINGRGLLTIEPYSPTTDVDVTSAIRIGENRITVDCKSVGGPAAIALSLEIVSADGSRTTLVSDGDWSSGTGRAVSQGPVEAALWGIGRRRATIDPFDNYEQWRQAVGAPAAGHEAAFWTPPGFEISLVRAAQSDEGSWVSMAFDPKGRLTIAREDQGLLRMTLADDRRSVTKVETINRELLECRGLLYADNALYANANNSKGLYRLRDTDGDDQFDEVKLLRQFPGGVGHGRNDLALGPDGMIYSMHGDSVEVPRENVRDRTSPLREARRGQTTSEGNLVRTDKDGKQWEVVCGGLRNPFGIAFNGLGDLFTYDADAEFDMGTPWYRPTRIVQLVSGADYGWRGVTGKWPPYFPDHADNALPTLDIGKGSPTAVVFGTGANFPADYQRALFILDWAYGRIVAVHLAPRGAGYGAMAETFLKGRPLNVTDLTIGPDGAMYVVTGGRKTQSALYRIAYTGAEEPPKPSPTHESDCRQHAAAARKLRLELEECHRPVDPAQIDSLWPHLDSPDPFVRHAARIAIEHQPLDRWRERALAEKRTTAALTALVALARTGDKSSVPAIVGRLASLPAGELDFGQTLLLLRGLALCRELSPEAVEQHQGRIISQLAPLVPHPAAWPHVSPAGSGAAVQREVAQLLVQLGAPDAVQKTAAAFLTSSVQEDRLMGLFILRHAKEGWTTDTRRAYFAALNEGGRYLSGEGMPRFLSTLREEALATLSDAERKELGDLVNLAVDAADDEPPPVRPVVKKWTLEDFAPLLADDKLQPSAERGAIVFRDALCVRCHRVGARGPAVGPDLTHVAGRFSRRDMLESILAPNKVVAENYRNVQIRTQGGRTIVGRVLIAGDYRSEKLQIATEPLRPSTIVEVNKREIEENRLSDTSPMPAGLLDTFTAQEVLDLLAYLESGAAVAPTGR
ncbi:MAG TPA: PQQ-dependent sugar dehydrogenase [Pirellulaceae bacterium]|nr:PQQ-dependent sugar dehydrogenase [Pirellulaceae bacterium]